MTLHSFPSHDDANLYAYLSAAWQGALRQKVAISTDSGLRYTYDDVDRASARIANVLEALALPAQSRIVVQVHKSVEALLLYLACLRAGHVFVPLNTAYGEHELRDFLVDAQAHVLVCSPEHFGWQSQLAFAHGVEHVYTLSAARSGTLLSRAALQPDQHTVAQVPSTALAAMIYTSGTTGRSKGAMLSHDNLVANAAVLHHYWDMRQDDVLLHVLPIFHVHGLFVACHAALLAAASMQWQAKFEAESAAQALQHCTVMMGVPTLYSRLLELPTWPHEDQGRAWPGVRLFISGSAPLAPPIFTAWQQRSGRRILERYGMSETIMLTSNPYLETDEHPRRVGTVGMPLPGVALRIAGGAAVGEIEVQSASVFQGYWQMPEKTAAEFTADGYFRTGDIGSIDAQGYVTISGRAKDLIISGGYNIYPAEIENALLALPGVAECAVIGTPHADLGEVGVAIIVPAPHAKPDATALLASLPLAPFKKPKRCVFVETLPRNAMGKVQKNVLRQQFAG